LDVDVVEVGEDVLVGVEVERCGCKLGMDLRDGAAFLRGGMRGTLHASDVVTKQSWCRSNWLLVICFTSYARLLKSERRLA
jgi:hypothetical protein